MMGKNPAVDATVPKAKKQEREIWTAEMLMQALEACDNKMLKIAFHLAFTATLRIGELLGLTWDDMDISEEAIADNKAYVIINKQVVADHIVLEAEDLGLSSCWLTYFDPEIIRNEFNIPSNLEPIAIIAVGYADTEKASPDRHSKDRKALESLVCYETF